VTTIGATRAGKAVGENAALQVTAEFPLHMGRGRVTLFEKTALFQLLGEIENIPDPMTNTNQLNLFD
jgi:hypothetical protein